MKTFFVCCALFIAALSSQADGPPGIVRLTSQGGSIVTTPAAGAGAVVNIEANVQDTRPPFNGFYEYTGASMPSNSPFLLWSTNGAGTIRHIHLGYGCVNPSSNGTPTNLQYMLNSTITIVTDGITNNATLGSLFSLWGNVFSLSGPRISIHNGTLGTYDNVGGFGGDRMLEINFFTNANISITVNQTTSNAIDAYFILDGLSGVASNALPQRRYWHCIDVLSNLLAFNAVENHLAHSGGAAELEEIYENLQSSNLWFHYSDVQPWIYADGVSITGCGNEDFFGSLWYWNNGHAYGNNEWNGFYASGTNIALPLRRYTCDPGFTSGDSAWRFFCPMVIGANSPRILVTNSLSFVYTNTTANGNLCSRWFYSGWTAAWQTNF